MSLDSPMPGPTLTISVILTTYSVTRAWLLDRALQSLAAQDEQPHEVIIVVEDVSGLTEMAATIVSKCGVPNATILRNPGPPGSSAARNVGIATATGTWLAFIDDDVVVPQNWTQALGRAILRHPDAVGIAGGAYPIWVDRTLEWLPRSCLWLVSCTGFLGATHDTQVRGAWSMNMALRADAVRQVGGFSERAGFANSSQSLDRPIAEDLELSLRLRRTTGMRIYFCPGSDVGHHVLGYRRSLRYVVARGFHVGSSNAIARRKYPDLDEGLPAGAVAKSMLRDLLLGPTAAPVWQRLRIIGAALAGGLAGYLHGTFAPIPDRGATGGE